MLTALVRDVTVDLATGAALPLVTPIERSQFERGQRPRKALIDAFVDRRLLTLEGDGLTVRARPTHEALLRNWPQAVGVISEYASP